MRRIYKGLIASVLVLAILILGTPYFFGFAVKGYMQRYVDRSNKLWGDTLGVHLKVVNYKQGWFHSTAELSVEKSGGGDAPVSTQVPLNIKHGPIFYLDGRLAFGLAGVASQSVDVYKDTPYRFSLANVIEFNGVERVAVRINNTVKDNKADFIPGVGFESLNISFATGVHAKKLGVSADVVKLHVKSLDSSVGFASDNVAADLQLNHLKDNQWKSVLDLHMHKSQAVLGVDQSKPDVTVIMDNLILKQLHLDSEKVMQLAGQLNKINAKDEVKRPNLFGAWIQWFQSALSGVVAHDTSMRVDGLTVKTPMGPIMVNYHVSFPSLQADHDYFDVALSEVGGLNIAVPYFHIIHDQKNSQFSLNNLELKSNSATLLSRQTDMSLDLLQVGPVHAESKQPQYPYLYLQGMTYAGRLTGHGDQLSQTLQLGAKKLCLYGECFDNIDTQLQFLNLDVPALRNLSTVFLNIETQAGLKQQDQQQLMMQWMEMMSAYAKLIRPDTKVLLSIDMMSPKGKIALKGGVAWPVASQDADKQAGLPQSAYQMRFEFPAAYYDDYHNGLQARKEVGHVSPVYVWVNYLVNKDYLKKQGDAYFLNLTGKGSQVEMNGKPWVMPTGAELGLAQPAQDTEAQDQLHHVNTIQTAPVQD